MDYIRIVTKDVMNKIFYSISDEYGYENVPYELGNGNLTLKIEIPMWRYDKKFITNLLLKHNLRIDDLNKEDIIFLDGTKDIYR